MRRLMRFVVTILAAVALTLVAAHAGHAKEAAEPLVVGDEGAPYGPVERALPSRVESVLTDPVGATIATKRGTAWLLHYGTERDHCSRADATPGLRVVCVAW